MAGNNTPPLEDMARCLVVSGLFMEPGEDMHVLQAKIEQLLEAMSCSHCLVAQFKRMGQGQHPLVKVAMANQKHKAEVLQKRDYWLRLAQHLTGCTYGQVCPQVKGVVTSR